jgi:predicted TIM-barrel fold metal-dependent hydrolase
MSNWKQTTQFPENRRIFEEELNDFLPAEIFDFHVHISAASALKDSSGWAISAGGNLLKEYTVEELTDDLGVLWPGRRCMAVCFGMPFPSLDIALQNDYVARSCDSVRFFPFRLLDPHDHCRDVERDIRKRNFLGFKPYPDYVRKPAEDVTIADMIPDDFLAIADRYRLCVTLHIPRKGRLADMNNINDINRICGQFPRANIILAHIGRAYFLKNIKGNLEKIARHDNLYFDLAMLNNSDVLAYLFERVPPERILFGTDIPVALAAGKSVEINNQYVYVTPVQWRLAVCDERGLVKYTSFAYEQVRAIRAAMERVGLPHRFAEEIFSKNAVRLISEMKQTA